jgi:hypothetical protein
MTPEQFCYWLQGRAELMPDTPPSESEWKMIGEHLAAVFKKVTPPLTPNVIFKHPPDFKIQDGGAVPGVYPLQVTC